MSGVGDASLPGFHTSWGGPRGPRRTGFGGVGDDIHSIVRGVEGAPGPTDARAVARIYELHAPAPMYGDRIIDVCLGLSAVASTNGQLVAAFRMPSAYQGTIRFFANSFTNPSSSGSITWSVKINDAPLPGFARFVGLKAPGLLAPMPVRFDLNPTDRISVVVDNASTGAITVGVRLFGWAWVMGALGAMDDGA